jgi:phage protein D
LINDPYDSQTAVRDPRLRVMSNGQPIPGALSASVTATNTFHADQFSLSFAASAGPDGWWDVDPPWILDVQISLDGIGWQSLIVGEVDHLTFHPTTGLLEAEGRDLSARMIETKTQEAFANQTSSEVATTIAARHGMTAQVVPTKTLVGRYYTEDHSRMTADQFSRTTTEWDLLIYLAQREGYDLFVSGMVLYFQPSTSANADPYVINWAQGVIPRMNVTSLQLERSLTLAKDVQVDVRSWNSRQARSFTKTARAIGGKAANTGSSVAKGATSTQRYVLVRPNLTEDQAQQLANQTAADITRNERAVAIEMPGELTLTPRTMLQIQGTGTSFDQTYWIESIDRSISFDEGFRQSVRCKNTSPRSMAQV